jgi:hypothetical protein
MGKSAPNYNVPRNYPNGKISDQPMMQFSEIGNGQDKR